MSENLPNLPVPVSRVWGSKVCKSCDFYCKSLREPTSIKTFCVKIGLSLIPSVAPEKIKKPQFHAAKETELIRSNNIGSFYNFVHSRLKSRSRIHDIRRADGSFASSSDEKAKIFNRCFASVFTADNGTAPHFPLSIKH